jgi:protein involved in polysaccharide export with SLBB domain
MFKPYLLLLTGFAVFTAAAQIPTPLPLNHSASTPVSTVGAGVVPSPAGPASASGLFNGYVPDATYKLRVGDTISFQIEEDRIWNSLDEPKQLVVTDSGEVDVPYIGREMAVNKTCQQLSDNIKAALEKDYYKKATVVLSLNVANRILGRIYIWGQVHNQGALDIEMNENLTAGEAILRAGGFADFADKTKVKVVRATPDATGNKPTFDLNMEQILEQGRREKDIVLQPGDLVIVPSRLVNF